MVAEEPANRPLHTALLVRAANAELAVQSVDARRTTLTCGERLPSLSGEEAPGWGQITAPADGEVGPQQAATPVSKPSRRSHKQPGAFHVPNHPTRAQSAAGRQPSSVGIMCRQVHDFDTSTVCVVMPPARGPLHLRLVPAGGSAGNRGCRDLGCPSQVKVAHLWMGQQLRAGAGQPDSPRLHDDAMRGQSPAALPVFVILTLCV